MKELILERKFFGISIHELSSLLFESDFFVEAQKRRGSSKIVCSGKILIFDLF